MRSFLFSAFMLFSFHFVCAQVGIGTAAPAATLDVTALNPTGTATDVDGIIIPRVTRERAQSMAGTPTSTMIYVSEVVTGTATGTTVNVTSVGFYFFNGTAWERLGTGTTNGWTTIGNTGIVDGVNYIGTAALTNVDVAFRRNNLAAGKIGATSTSFGLGALTSGASTNSSAFGNNALAANSTGAANVAVGTSALATNTTSSNNTAVGFSSLNANTAAGNSALGYRALGSNSSGANNTAVGFDAGFALSSGSNNIMIGANTVAPSATGSDQLNIGNTIYGSIGATKNIGINQTTPQGALDIVSSNNGILIPRLALLVGANSSSPVTTIADSEVIYNTASVGAGINAVTPGFYYWNTATSRWIRFNTGAATGWLTTGNAGLTAGTNFIGTTDAVDVSFRRNNTASGFIGANNTAFGVGTLASNSGTNNTAFGTNALAANNTPADNTAIGYNALATNTFNAGGGNQNTAVGSGALATLNGGIGNTAVGYNALNASATLSQFNTAVGAGAMSGTNNAASQDNVAVGYNSLRQPGTITRTVAIGSNALVNAANNSTRNTAIGAFAGSATTTGTDNVFIGNSAGSAEAGASNNKLYIENTNANASNALIYGEFDTNILRVNGTLQVNNPAGVTGYALPNVRGNANEILRTDGAGGTSWVAASTIETDPQVSSTTTNAIPRWNGTTLVDGVLVDNATNVGVGMTPVAGNRLDVSGKTRTTSLETANFQMTTGANPNYVLQSDATGNASWVNPTVKPYTTTGTLTGIYNVSLAEYTVRVFNDVSEVRLPAAAGNIGKVYIIIGSNLITTKILSTVGGVIYDDVTNATITTINPNERYMLQSDGNLNWIVIGR